MLGWTLFVCVCFSISAGAGLAAYKRLHEMQELQEFHTTAIKEAIRVQSTFAKSLLAKVEEARKQRLQTERIERRKRKEASYNRRRNRGHRKGKK